VASRRQQAELVLALRRHVLQLFLEVKEYNDFEVVKIWVLWVVQQKWKKSTGSGGGDGKRRERALQLLREG
jgi:hypothetical protein